MAWQLKAFAEDESELLLFSEIRPVYRPFDWPKREEEASFTQLTKALCQWTLNPEKQFLCGGMKNAEYPIAAAYTKCTCWEKVLKNHATVWQLS